MGINHISDAAVKKATGKTWDEWIVRLDKLGAKMMAHRDIARMLYDRKMIKNGWWCQMVTNGYEQARGRRVLGQSEDAGFQIGVRKTLRVSPREAWRAITSPRGVKLWLGDVASLKFKPGQSFVTRDGTAGEIRTVRPGQRVRLTYQPRGMRAATTLQVTVIPRQTTQGTCISFHHEKLASAKERKRMRRHWQNVLQALQHLTPAVEQLG